MNRHQQIDKHFDILIRVLNQLDYHMVDNFMHPMIHLFSFRDDWESLFIKL